ncbi:uncharacterized protein LOC110232921 isoform X1 [Exaiptasia diaphana]|uniref:Uncharacterized protein n=1 Tax=Exaiptasia diaphana TaxID=2652724 RepID=A0A913WTB1_EXADI|nr:uncharacterized protein LOC110232921 isoform X1 [Exaiptasia diaphana]KXJ27885.1 hypothetical protein AC249_AIPGENE2940 [Exaiptasia diaphana]
MNKLTVLFLLASVIALTWALPKEERPSKRRLLRILPHEAMKMKKRSHECSPSAIAALKHYGLDARLCGKSKRVEADFSRLLQRRELEYAISKERYDQRRGFNACCSPDCDWLLDYLEIDSTVVKCVDKK